jgi:hypothetical protein
VGVIAGFGSTREAGEGRAFFLGTEEAGENEMSGLYASLAVGVVVVILSIAAGAALLSTGD